MPSQQRKSNFRRFLGVLFLSSLTLCLWLSHLPLPVWQAGFGEVATAQSPNVIQLVQQGVLRYQAGDFKGAISPWQTALTFYQKTNSRPNKAIVLENLARAYQQLGQSEQALNHWQQALAYYRQIGDTQQVGRMLTEQAQTYSSMGQPRAAIALLCGAYGTEQSCVPDSALEIARSQNNKSLEVAALGSLGNTYLLMGEYRQAIAYFQSSLKVANAIDNVVYRSSTLNSLGNAYINLAQLNYRRGNLADQRGDQIQANRFREQAVKYDSEALKHFQNSLNLARTQNDLTGELRSLLNSIAPYYRTKASNLADAAVQQALVLLQRIPDTRDKVYAAITLANFVQPVSAIDVTRLENECVQKVGAAYELLNKAISIARQLQDSRSESFALGKLGHLYECRQDYDQALSLTQQAQWAADQDLSAKDSLYLWEWQVGRILKAQRKQPDAITAYERAIATLESIRGDILTANRDLQFDFRDAVSPIYRELAQLRLDRASLSSINANNRTKELSSALSTIDSLKLAELQNYFGNDCVLTALNPARVDLAGVGTATAVFSSIILGDRTAVLVSFPNGEKRLAWINLDSESLRQEINEFRSGLERYRDFIYDPRQAQKLYDWIVRPFASDLNSLQIKTLVFIQDGILRSVPMAALHDGTNFLVEKYAIATTPSLTLTAPKTLNHQALQALAVGLTKSATVNGRKFPALLNVGSEISQVEEQIPGSKPLLNENFTLDRLRQELSETVYPIIHIATHGEFGTDPEDTFLVTGNNSKLTIYDLETAIRSISRESGIVELLALTACQTAVGDDRAALGLAGVAVQAGVGSALASLWFIQDAPTVTLVDKFYGSLHNSGMSKAEALSAAQQSLISAGGLHAHPAYWAPFILIGNWL